MTSILLTSDSVDGYTFVFLLMVMDVSCQSGQNTGAMAHKLMMAGFPDTTQSLSMLKQR